MRISCKLVTMLLGVLFIATGAVNAQDGSDEAAVWAVVEQQWDREERGDNRWMDELLVEDFMAWPNSAPAPRNQESTRMWNEFGNKQSKTLEHELYPLSIVVHGDMAIAHYLYTQAVEDRDDEVTVSNGRFTDVLVRDEGQWKFISWHGGDEPDDD